MFLGSPDAFASMVGANIVFMMASYVIPQGILAWRGRDKLSPRPFNLGRYGYLINVTSCIWVTILVVLACLPTTRPVIWSNFNWVG
jgi:choline transport protein